MMPEADRNTMAALESRLKAVNKAIGNSGDAAQGRTTREEKRKELQKRNAEKREEKAMIIKQSWDLFFKVSGMGNNGTMGGMGSNGAMGAMGSMDGNGGMGAMGSMDGNGAMGSMDGMAVTADTGSGGADGVLALPASFTSFMQKFQDEVATKVSRQLRRDIQVAAANQHLDEHEDDVLQKAAEMYLRDARNSKKVFDRAVETMIQDDRAVVLDAAATTMIEDYRAEVLEHAAKRMRLEDEEEEEEVEEEEESDDSEDEQ